MRPLNLPVKGNPEAEEREKGEEVFVVEKIERGAPRGTPGGAPKSAPPHPTGGHQEELHARSVPPLADSELQRR